MKIEHIKKKGKNKYEILLENNQRINTYDTVILKYQIILKKELSEELLETIKEETKQAQVLEKTLQYMNRKRRSEKEVRAYLKEFDLDNEEEIINYLKGQGFFDVDSYIEAYIHDRFIFSNDGPNKIKKELLEQGFDESRVNDQIEQIDAFEIKQKLSKLIIKKMNTNHKYSEGYWKQKVLYHLVQLGYHKCLVEEILEGLSINHESILENDARKLFQRYQGKKPPLELRLFLKQKLYQKQYPIDDINQVLEKIYKEKDLL